jgi:hypothetical protein
MIDIWGADHGGYVKRMKAAVSAITAAKGALDVKLCQLVRVLRNGELVRMSKRAGTFVTLRDLLDEVGPDVVRFTMLTRKNDAPFDFDLVKATEQSRDNPVWYVQYGYARTRSVMRQASTAGIAVDGLGSASLDHLADAGELALIRLIAQWPRQVEAAALAHEPHRIAFYLYDLAAAFHGHWNRGKDEPSLRFVVEGDSETTRARLALVQAVGFVIESGLSDLRRHTCRRDEIRKKCTSAGPPPATDQRSTDPTSRSPYGVNRRLGPSRTNPIRFPPPPRDSLLAKVNRRRGTILTMMVSIAAIASFGSVVWWAHNQDVRAGGKGLEPLVVQAPATPTRVKPENAGGLVPPDQDKEVYNRIAPGAVPTQPEKLLPGSTTPRLPAGGIMPTPSAPKDPEVAKTRRRCRPQRRRPHPHRRPTRRP